MGSVWIVTVEDYDDDVKIFSVYSNEKKAKQFCNRMNKDRTSSYRDFYQYEEYTISE